MVSCSSLSPFFHIPTFLIQQRKQQLLFKLPPFLHQTNLPSPLSLSRKKLHKCFSQQKETQSIQEEKEEEEEAFQFERLFSNINQVTLKREPGWLHCYMHTSFSLLFYFSLV